MSQIDQQQHDKHPLASPYWNTCRWIISRNKNKRCWRVLKKAFITVGTLLIGGGGGTKNILFTSCPLSILRWLIPRRAFKNKWISHQGLVLLELCALPSLTTCRGWCCCVGRINLSVSACYCAERRVPRETNPYIELLSKLITNTDWPHTIPPPQTPAPRQMKRKIRGRWTVQVS